MSEQKLRDWALRGEVPDVGRVGETPQEPIRAVNPPSCLVCGEEVEHADTCSVWQTILALHAEEDDERIHRCVNHPDRVADAGLLGGKWVCQECRDYIVSPADPPTATPEQGKPEDRLLSDLARMDETGALPEEKLLSLADVPRVPPDTVLAVRPHGTPVEAAIRITRTHADPPTATPEHGAGGVTPQDLLVGGIDAASAVGQKAKASHSNVEGNEGYGAREVSSLPSSRKLSPHSGERVSDSGSQGVPLLQSGVVSTATPEQGKELDVLEKRLREMKAATINRSGSASEGKEVSIIHKTVNVVLAVIDEVRREGAR